MIPVKQHHIVIEVEYFTSDVSIADVLHNIHCFVVELSSFYVIQDS